MLREFLTNGLEELEADCGGETFTWKTAEVPCVASMLERGIVMAFGGQEVEVQMSLNVRKENFSSADSSLITVDSDLTTVDDGKRHPVSGCRLTFRGKTYRILRVTEDPTRLYYKLTLSDNHSGR